MKIASYYLLFSHRQAMKFKKNTRELTWLPIYPWMVGKTQECSLILLNPRWLFL